MKQQHQLKILNTRKELVIYLVRKIMV